MNANPTILEPLQLPFVSVVIPVYNQSAFLERCLGSVFGQTYPRERFEVILVDDGSGDNTAEIAQKLAAGWDGQCVVVRKPNGGPATARNAGLHRASGEVIVFIDSDCVAEPDWLAHLIDALVSGNADGVGGPLVNVCAPGWVARYLTAVSFYRHRTRHGNVEYLVTANVAFRRAALETVEGFRENGWGEDADLSFRLIQSGHKLLLSQRGVVNHYGTPLSVRGLVRELYRYGFGSVILAHNWRASRQPIVQLIRHVGAVALSPLLALSLARRVGLSTAIAFCPLIIVEHAAFSVGILGGLLSGHRRTDSEHGHGYPHRQRHPSDTQ